MLVTLNGHGSPLPKYQFAEKVSEANGRCRKLEGDDSAEFTHAAVAAFIASGMADVGVGVQTAAQRFGLHFIALVRERYFLAFAKANSRQPPVSQVLKLLCSPAYRSAVAALPGYEAGDTGRVLGIDEAFAL